MKFIFKCIRKLILFVFVLLIIAASIVGFIGYSYFDKTISEKSLNDRVNSITSKDNFTSYSELPVDYINAVIATEDHRYYSHGPVDFIGLLRASLTNLKHKEFREGGSTITQQVSKNVIFNQDKSLIRKAGELFGAFELENNYSKDEIFALYVNTCYFGDGYYNIYDASMGYFGKLPKDLSLNEASMLAGVPNAPSLYSPRVNMELCKKRQKHVLNKMVEENYISQEDADRAFSEDVKLVDKTKVINKNKNLNKNSTKNLNKNLNKNK